MLWQEPLSLGPKTFSVFGCGESKRYARVISFPVRVLRASPGDSVVPRLLTELCERTKTIDNRKIFGLDGDAISIACVQSGHTTLRNGTFKQARLHKPYRGRPKTNPGRRVCRDHLSTADALLAHVCPPTHSVLVAAGTSVITRQPEKEVKLQSRSLQSHYARGSWREPWGRSGLSNSAPRQVSRGKTRQPEPSDSVSKGRRAHAQSPRRSPPNTSPRPCNTAAWTGTTGAEGERECSGPRRYRRDTNNGTVQADRFTRQDRANRCRLFARP
jgi:hypothetical protein